MQPSKANLFTGFQEDPKLDASFHPLSEHLRTGDTSEVGAVARHLDERNKLGAKTILIGGRVSQVTRSLWHSSGALARSGISVSHCHSTS